MMKTIEEVIKAMVFTDLVNTLDWATPETAEYGGNLMEAFSIVEDG